MLLYPRISISSNLVFRYLDRNKQKYMSNPNEEHEQFEESNLMHGKIIILIIIIIIIGPILNRFTGGSLSRFISAETLFCLRALNMNSVLYEDGLIKSRYLQ